jgi:hypothetical protein
MTWTYRGRTKLIKSSGEAPQLVEEATLLDSQLSIKGIGMSLSDSYTAILNLFSRFLRMASDTSSANRTITFAAPPSFNTYVSTAVPVSRLNSEVMDTAFVKAVSPESYPGGLQALMDSHRFGDSVPLGKHWSYKYLVDLDGMSYSGRFMAFLASDSVPIKATVYEEFFSDWIQPWCVFFVFFS